MPSGAASDSNYVAVTRHRRPFSKANTRPTPLLVWDNHLPHSHPAMKMTTADSQTTVGDGGVWSSRLEPDDVLLSPEVTMGPMMMMMMDDGEDRDAVVVVTRSINEERRRREQGWNDLGLELILDANPSSSSSTIIIPTTAAAAASAATTAARNQQSDNNNNNTSTASTI